MKKRQNDKINRKEYMDRFALIKPFEFKDSLTGNTINFSISEQYSVLSLANRNYYFVRETGEFDGTSTDLTAFCEEE